MVNDEIITVMILEALLTKQLSILTDHVHRAHNGLEAYDKATCGNFDLIIMDLNMPIMDGFRSTRKIKEYFESSNMFINEDINNLRTPPYIVALSASAIDHDLVQKCKEYKFDDWFSSPLDFNILKVKVIDVILVKKNIHLYGTMEIDEEALIQEGKALLDPV